MFFWCLLKKKCDVNFNILNVSHLFPFPSDIALYKRAPMGFLGMRGKKDSEYTNIHKRARLGLKVSHKHYFFKMCFDDACEILYYFI